MFGVNMTFISSSEVKKMYISWVPNAQADLNLRTSHMSEGTFSEVAAIVIF